MRDGRCTFHNQGAGAHLTVDAAEGGINGAFVLQPYAAELLYCAAYVLTQSSHYTAARRAQDIEELELPPRTSLSSSTTIHITPTTINQPTITPP
ncbi:MAG TPA: hypothetical protein VL728_01530 [Cyclobacteriaceae bacterium]|nr:hypothetical protein [Cyclobacteriaceae bacterium]